MGHTLLRYRNRAEITALTCKQKRYLVLFSCMRKNYSVGCEHTLTLLYYIAGLLFVEMLTALSVLKTKIMTWVLLMRADQSSSTIKRNNMEQGKHVQLTLDLFQPSAVNAIVFLSCFIVCFRFCSASFSSRHVSPTENIYAPQKKTWFWVMSKNRKIRFTLLNKKEG